MPTMNTAKYDAESDLPNLEQHNNHMAHVLTLDLYNSLRGKMTPSGFTVDGAIQTGVDNPGNFKIGSSYIQIIIIIYFIYYINWNNINPYMTARKENKMN